MTPVLGRDDGPPKAVGLVVGTDAEDETTPKNKIPRLERGIRATPSVLRLRIKASGCSNPVKLEGELIRAKGTWITEEWGKSHAPRQAIVGFSGAAVRSAGIGVDSLSGGGPGRASIRTSPVDDPDHVVTVYNHTFPLVRKGASSVAAILDAPRWPKAKTPLGFVVEADLVRQAGFHSCYVAVPELYEFSSSPNNAAFVSAEHVFDLAGNKLSGVTGDVEEDDENASDVSLEEIGAAEVEVSVGGRAVVASTIGEGGEAVDSKVEYRCRPAHNDADYPAGVEQSLLPLYVKSGNPDCSGAPLFQAVDVTSDTTRRLFFAGIIGALAATIIVEALFLGETDDGHGVRARTRWPRAPSQSG